MVWPEDPDLCIGRPIAFHREITPPSDQLHPAQPESARRLLSSHHQCSRKTHRNRVKFLFVKDVGIQSATGGRNSHEPRMICKGFTRVLRSEPIFHDLDGASLWTAVIVKVREKATEN